MYLTGRCNMKSACSFHIVGAFVAPQQWHLSVQWVEDLSRCTISLTASAALVNSTIPTRGKTRTAAAELGIHSAASL
jgi:uncharacterized protein YjlB